MTNRDGGSILCKSNDVLGPMKRLFHPSLDDLHIDARTDYCGTNESIDTIKTGIMRRSRSKLL